MMQQPATYDCGNRRATYSKRMQHLLSNIDLIQPTRARELHQ
jgi:hypothetical protein